MFDRLLTRVVAPPPSDPVQAAALALKEALLPPGVMTFSVERMQALHGLAVALHTAWSQTGDVAQLTGQVHPWENYVSMFARICALPPPTDSAAFARYIGLLEEQLVPLCLEGLFRLTSNGLLVTNLLNAPPLPAGLAILQLCAILMQLTDAVEIHLIARRSTRLDEAAQLTAERYLTSLYSIGRRLVLHRLQAVL